MTTFNSEGLKPAEERVGFYFKIKLSSAADPFQDACSGPGAEACTPRPGAVTVGIHGPCSMAKGHPGLR